MDNRKRTARLAGITYLLMAISAMLGFLAFREQLLVAGRPAETLANLQQHETLARAAIALLLTVIVTQALAGYYFFRLYREATPASAVGILTFGLVNSVIIMVGTTFAAGALAVATDPGLAPAGGAAALVQLLYTLDDVAWSVGGLFFGLWLIPMGYAARTSGFQPPALGHVLVIGGVCYIISPYIAALWPDARAVLNVLVIPATIGEFWMIGHLLIFGVRTVASASDDGSSTA